METQSRQPLWRKLAYSGGSLGASVAGQVVGFYLLLFYVDITGLPISYYKLGMVIYSIWNAINDPLFGYISDRTKSRWGRRIPYILWLSLPFAVSFALLWYIPAAVASNPFFMFLYFVGALFVFDTLFTVVVLNWTALFPEMYPTLEERSQVSALRQILALIGLVIGVALAPVLYSSIGWAKMGAIFAVIVGLGMYVSLLGSKELPEAQRGEAVSLIPAIKYTFGNRNFVTFVLVSFLIQLCFGIMEAAMPLYAKYVLRMPDAQVTFLWAAIFGSALVMFFFWPAITNKLAPRRSTMLATVLFGLGLIPFLFLSTFKSALTVVPFIGVGLAGLMMLLDVLIADVIDEDQLRTGTRREGMYFGVNGFVIRLSIALQGWIIGSILAAGGYIPGVGVAAQPPTVIPALRVLMTWVPWVGLALALLVAYLHQLDGQRLAEMKKKLARVQSGQAAGH